jgi:hypothetical protein
MRCRRPAARSWTRWARPCCRIYCLTRCAPKVKGLGLPPETVALDLVGRARCTEAGAVMVIFEGTETSSPQLILSYASR